MNKENILNYFRSEQDTQEFSDADYFEIGCYCCVTDALAHWWDIGVKLTAAGKTEELEAFLKNIQIEDKNDF